MAVERAHGGARDRPTRWIAFVLAHHLASAIAKPRCCRPPQQQALARRHHAAPIRAFLCDPIAAMRAMQGVAPSRAVPLPQQQRLAGRRARPARRLAVKMMAPPKQMLVRRFAAGPALHTRAAAAVAAAAATAAAAAQPPLPCPCAVQIYVPPHPLVKHWLGVMRNKDTPAAIFRTAAAGGVWKPAACVLAASSRVAHGMAPARLGPPTAAHAPCHPVLAQSSAAS